MKLGGISSASIAQAITAQVPDVMWASVIGGSGTGVVPASIRERFNGNVANARTDFGVRLYENGVDGALRNNQEKLQLGIDKLQPSSGAMWFSPNENGVSSVLCGPLIIRDGAGLNSKGISFLGQAQPDSTSGVDGNYIYGNTLKLPAGSNTHLITVAPRAGHFVAENMGFDGNGTQQTAGDVIRFEDNNSGEYGYGPKFRNVYVSAGKAHGVYHGVGRGKAEYNQFWVQYCLAAGGAPAWNLNSYDVQVMFPAIGENAGLGVYVGLVAQLEWFGGAIWHSGLQNMVISEYALDLRMFGLSFDGAKGGHQLVVVPWVAGGSDERHSSRSIIGCAWRQRPGALPNNTYNDIYCTDPATDFLNPSFMGRQSVSDPRVKYHIGGTGRISVTNPVYGDDTFATAAIDPAVALREVGRDEAYWGKAAGVAGMSAYVALAEKFRIATARTSVFNNFEIVSDTPRTWWADINASTPANNKKWMDDAYLGARRFYAASDDEASFLQWMNVRRGGTTTVIAGFPNLPTSSSGLTKGELYTDGSGFVKTIL